MHDLGDHGQSLHGPRSHSGSEEQVRKVCRSAIGRCGQIAIESSCVHISGTALIIAPQTAGIFSDVGCADQSP